MDEKPWIESLVSCLPDGVAFVRPDWKLLWGSRSFAAMLRLEGSAKGLALDGVIEDFEEFRASAVAMLAERERVDLPVRLALADGDTLEASACVARCREGLAAAWSISIRPAGELETLRRQLQQRERSHSFLMAASSDVILRVDEDLVVTWANDAAQSFFRTGEEMAKALATASVTTLAEMVDDRDLAQEKKSAIELEAAKGRNPWFLLRGYLRRLVDEGGASIGASLVLRDDSNAKRVDAAAARLGLSPKEKVVVEYLLQGYSNLNIAAILGLSESGVKFHVRNIFARAKVSSRAELLATLLAE